MLAIVSGTNVGNVRNVLWALQRRFSQQTIDTVTVLVETQLGVKMHGVATRDDLATVLGPSVQVRVQPIINDHHAVIPKVVAAAVRERIDGSEIIIDLTTGSKPTSSVLYASASLSRLEHVYYVEVDRYEVTREGKSEFRFYDLPSDRDAEQHHRVVSFAQIADLHQLATHGYFHLIFYRDTLDALKRHAPESIRSRVTEIVALIANALQPTFRATPENRAAMMAIGNAWERIRELATATLESYYGLSPDPTKDAGTQWSLARAKLTERRNSFVGAEHDAPEFMSVPGLLVVDHIIAALAAWRNKVNHAMPGDYSEREVRTALVMSLQLLGTLIELSHRGGVSR
jgi:hypothetical protein